jgi:hypothetical protein
VPFQADNVGIGDSRNLLCPDIVQEPEKLADPTLIKYSRKIKPLVRQPGKNPLIESQWVAGRLATRECGR